MPTFPKYMVKRLVPENAVTLVGDELHVKIVNVLATIPFEKVPDHFIKLSTIKVDGEVVISPDKPELVDKVKLVVRGKAYPITGIKDIEGGDLPPGETMELVVPNVKKFAKGETHSLEATLYDRPKKADPLVIAFERKIY